ncbi:copper ABC transporter substrate-binding protein [Thermosipho sp. (in: thermotogales)]|uniref:copper ABC transporter substrate-binding protein n=1 Tax=Thermosipho sp. (in: thermotogales) TaxID=1968895 RepID=UPI00257A946C|nr:copper ABC transporter substrate-binding protein [Thermosipho sp. (in: thermotogales)]MBZ4651107.1 putative periplasmic copper-binding protein NosD [Thermosipho sp. (in: thermotogales)]
MKKSLVIIFLLVFSIILVSETIIVEENIQQAIDKAKDGDIIYLKAGTYKENLSIVSKNLTLVGEEGAYISYVGKDPKNIFNSSPTIYIENSNVIIKNLEIGSVNSIGIGLLNSKISLSNVNMNLDNAYGVVCVADEEKESFLEVSNLSVEDVNYKSSSGKNVSLNFNSVGIMLSGDSMFVANNIEMKGMKNGLILNNKMSYIYNSDFLENENVAIILSGQQKFINNRFELNVETFKVANSPEVELVGNVFKDNSYNFVIKKDDYDSYQNFRHFSGKIIGFSNILQSPEILNESFGKYFWK